jgi:hypothetical protein
MALMLKLSYMIETGELDYLFKHAEGGFSKHTNLSEL